MAGRQSALGGSRWFRGRPGTYAVHVMGKSRYRRARDEPARIPGKRDISINHCIQNSSDPFRVRLKFESSRRLEIFIPGPWACTKPPHNNASSLRPSCILRRERIPGKRFIIRLIINGDLSCYCPQALRKLFCVHIASPGPRTEYPSRDLPTSPAKYQ